MNLVEALKRSENAIKKMAEFYSLWLNLVDLGESGGSAKSLFVLVKFDGRSENDIKENGGFCAILMEFYFHQV